MARTARNAPPGGHQSTAPIDGLISKAATRLQQGRHADTATLCRKALKRVPGHPVALHLLGVAQLGAGKPADAVETLRQAHDADPPNVEVRANLGAALRAAGKWLAAVEMLRAATIVAPAFVPAWLNLGNVLSDLGETAQARLAYDNVIMLDPGNVAARRQLAKLLAADGDGEAALAQIDAAAAAQPGDCLLHNERGLALINLGRADQAADAFRAALAIAPEDPDTLGNLGNALCASGDPGAALTLYRRALDVLPDCPITLANLGHAHRQLGALDEAVGAYEQALAESPDHREARFGRATCRLLLGDFAGGWDDYRFRETMGDDGRTLVRAPLDADLAGKRILLLRDQGLGDEIFFLRYLPRLGARGAEIAYRPDPRLAAMLARSGITIVREDAAPAAYDLTMAVCDLPYLLAGDDPAGKGAPPVPETISLSPMAGCEDALRDELASFGPPPYIGVAWRAGTRNRRLYLFKETPLARLAATLAPLEATVVVLQRGPFDDEVENFAAALGREVLDFSPLNDALEDLLALVGLLDEHVCVSNTNVHLAAARGRACRVLVPYPPEFRWMASGEQSPWFPGMPVYRQQADGDWGPAFAALARDLGKR